MPDFVEPSMPDDIAEFVTHHKLEAAAVQATAGLVGTYPVGAKTLHSTHALDQPHRRLSQSTRLFTGLASTALLAHPLPGHTTGIVFCLAGQPGVMVHDRLDRHAKKLGLITLIPDNAPG